MVGNYITIVVFVLAFLHAIHLQNQGYDVVELIQTGELVQR